MGDEKHNIKAVQIETSTGTFTITEPCGDTTPELVRQNLLRELEFIAFETENPSETYILRRSTIMAVNFLENEE